jgi:hypothetical protein
MFSALPLKADITLRTRYVRFVPGAEVVVHGRYRDARAALLRDLSQGRLVIAYEDALAKIELANSFLAANAGPPTIPPEARQMPGTM